MTDKTLYDQARAQLDFAPNRLLVAATLCWTTSLLGACVYLLSQPSRLCYWGAQLLLPVVFFEAFAILHDCGHGSCVRSRLGNTLIGHCMSVLCFMPYFPWKYIHTEHHVWAGDAEHDPSAALAQRARNTGKLPAVLLFAWRSWLPLAAVGQHLVFWSYPIVAARRGQLPPKRLVRTIVSVALLASAYVSLHLFAPRIVNLHNFGPGIVLYLAMVEFVNLPHHAGLTSFHERLPLWRQHLPTRSCSYPPVISEVLVLNFNFHIEHHWFPALPWYRLRQARRLLKPALGDAYCEAKSLQWIMQQRRRSLTEVIAPSV